MKNSSFSAIDDHEIVAGILANDPQVIEYFFFEKCSKLFTYIICAVFGGHVERDELMDELFIYLASDNWKKLREFNFRSRLVTYINVVAIRFFTKKRDSLIDYGSSETLSKYINDQLIYESIDTNSIDIRMAIQNMPNPRYQQAIELLDIKDMTYDDVAIEMGITVANLYNLHRRALAQLKLCLMA